MCVCVCVGGGGSTDTVDGSFYVSLNFMCFLFFFD